MIRCKSRIVRTFKTRKAEAIWPETVHGPQKPDLLEKYPEECGGEIHIGVEILGGGGCCCSYETPSIEMEVRCSKCNCPYFEGIFEIHGGGTEAVERALNGYYGD